MKEINHEKLQKAFEEIQMPRTPYVLGNMVVGSKYTIEQQYAQCVLELSIAYDNLRIAEAKQKLKELEIDKLGDSEEDKLNRIILEVEKEQTHRAMIGALREFEYLYGLWEQSPKFTREQLNDAQEKEFNLRIKTQAQQDLNAFGRISVGNQEALRQIGEAVYPQLDNSREVEKRFLEGGKCKMLLAVATEHKAESGLPCLDGLEFPNGVEMKIFNSWGRPVDENYNNIVQEALNDKADYIATVEDDTFPQPDALVKLLELLRKNPNSAVGAWYPKKEKSRQGVHIVLKDGKRQQMKDDGKIQEAYTLSMGCSIYPLEMFMKIPYPWFKTTANLSQDSYFSQLAREAGYKLLVDTSIKCGHQDRETKKMFT
jgi:hypothetical protein